MEELITDPHVSTARDRSELNDMQPGDRPPEKEKKKKVLVIVNTPERLLLKPSRHSKTVEFNLSA